MWEFFAGYLVGRSSRDSTPSATSYHPRPLTEAERAVRGRLAKLISFMIGATILAFFFGGGLASCVQQVTGTPEDCGKGSPAVSIVKQITTPECRR